MTSRPMFTAALAILGTITTAFAADPVVSNLTASQRAGTKLVDITYDVTADTPTVAITLRISSDGGTTFTVPSTTLTGAVGSNVPVGTGRLITWDAGTDWLGRYSTTMRFEVTAEAGTTVIPEGFAYVAAGALPTASWAGAQAVDRFFMAKTEVTLSEWQTVSSWAATRGYDLGSAGYGLGPNRPVTFVHWYQAVKWCNALSERDGLPPVYWNGPNVYRNGNVIPSIDRTAVGYRLPSEKEWEFAARGGVRSRGYEYSGSDQLESVAWFNITEPQDVGTKQANELGIYDMSGNVFEWCFDPDSTGSGRVVRGGGWGLPEPVYHRVADRSLSGPPDVDGYTGGGSKSSKH